MRTLVLHPDLDKPDARRAPERALAEAMSLTDAVGELELVGGAVVRVSKPRPGTLFGTGKVDEIAARCKEEEIGLVVIDGPLSPVQQRNLEREWKVKILDRTGLILEIFGDRAQTREGVLQVELAHLTYQKSRLVRSWTHLERQRGGLGFIGGPGETQIEADRRALDERILAIRKALRKVVQTRSLHRAGRKKVPFPIVALVGYTNAGKSTLFNRLTGADILAEDMLFATLDPTMRGLTLPSGQRVILSDTVGFISDLPTQLVAAFRATLEEVLDADLILHVRDIAHPETREQARDVVAILEDLGVTEARRQEMIEVLNKADLLPPDGREALARSTGRQEKQALISATTGEGVDALLQMVEEALAEATHRDTVTLDFKDGRARAWLFDQKVVDAEEQTETGYELQVSWTAKQQRRFEELLSRR